MQHHSFFRNLPPLYLYLIYFLWLYSYLQNPSPFYKLQAMKEEQWPAHQQDHIRTWLYAVPLSNSNKDDDTRIDTKN